MSDVVLTANVLIEHEVGLHARPSVKLTKLAKTFDAQVEVSPGPDGPWVDAKSIVKVMATRAPKGTVLHFRASGSAAQSALDALVKLVENDFETGAGDAD
jgi:phosphocarrier protein